MTVPVPDDVAARVRKFVFDHLLEHATPPVVEQVMTGFSLWRDGATDVLRALEAARHIALVKGTARILMAFPFSAIATPFRVTVGHRAYFANCAWDAIAFHAMLGEEIRVQSYCHHCANPIEIQMRHDRAVRVEPAGGARLPRPAPDSVVGGHHHHLLEHDGLLRLAGASRRIGPVPVGTL